MHHVGAGPGGVRPHLGGRDHRHPLQALERRARRDVQPVGDQRADRRVPRARHGADELRDVTSSAVARPAQRTGVDEHRQPAQSPPRRPLRAPDRAADRARLPVGVIDDIALEHQYVVGQHVAQAAVAAARAEAGEVR